MITLEPKKALTRNSAPTPCDPFVVYGCKPDPCANDLTFAVKRLHPCTISFSRSNHLDLIARAAKHILTIHMWPKGSQRVLHVRQVQCLQQLATLVHSPQSPEISAAAVSRCLIKQASGASDVSRGNT